MTERQKKAIALKGDHKIYYERDLNDPMGFIAAIANLDECISQPDGSYLFPDSTPDWLYDVLEALGYMTTFETLRKYKASLIIEEFGMPSKENFTKVVSIIFDKKNEFKIL